MIQPDEEIQGIDIIEHLTILKSNKHFLTALLIGFSFQANAKLCDHLPGLWQGTFTIKDPELCEIFDGCTHQIKADVCPDNFFANTNFEVNVTPSAGVAEFFYIACYNDVISSPYGFSGKITASCDLFGHCEMIYEDSKLLCKMNKK